MILKSFSPVIKNFSESNLNSKEYFLGVLKKIKYTNYLAKFMSEFSGLVKTYNEGYPKI